MIRKSRVFLFVPEKISDQPGIIYCIVNLMKKRLSALMPWIKQVVRKPHLVWRCDFTDGNGEILIKQPVIFFILLILLIFYVFYPLDVVVICWVALLAVFLFSYVWSRMLIEAIYAERKLKYAAYQVGDELEEDFVLKNLGWLPALWLEIVDHSDFPQYSINVTRALDENSKAEWRIRLICSKRGVFTLGPWEWISADPFGLFQIKRRILQSQKMVVYPPMANLSGDFRPYGERPGDLRPLNQPLSAESVQATQTRPYQSGDPLRRIHWRTSARRQNLYVKVFDPEAASRIWLIPDLDPNVHNSGKSEDWQDSSEETMILTLSALASMFIKENRAVGLYAGIDPPSILLPQRGAGHLWSILTELAPLHTKQTIPLEGILNPIRNIISPLDLIVVVTPSVNVEWMKSLSNIGMSSGNEVWAVLLDPKSFGMQGNGETAQQQTETMGIHTRLVKRGDIQIQLGSLGAIRRWEYMTLSTGRVVVRNRPRTAEDLQAFEVDKWV